jgi:hypothetical protein
MYLEVLFPQGKTIHHSYGNTETGGVHRTVEGSTITYEREEGRHHEAKGHIVNWIRDNGLNYHSMSADVIP